MGFSVLELGGDPVSRIGQELPMMYALELTQVAHGEIDQSL